MAKTRAGKRLWLRFQAGINLEIRWLVLLDMPTF